MQDLQMIKNGDRFRTELQKLMNMLNDTANNFSMKINVKKQCYEEGGYGTSVARQVKNEKQG